MRHLILLFVLACPLHAFELVEQENSVVRCSLMHFIDAKSQMSYSLILSPVIGSYALVLNDSRQDANKTVNLDKAKAMAMYRKLLALINGAQIEGDIARSGRDDVYLVDVSQGGFNIALKFPSGKKGFDNSAIKAIQDEFADLMIQAGAK